MKIETIKVTVATKILSVSDLEYQAIVEAMANMSNPDYSEEVAENDTGYKVYSALVDAQ